MSTNSIVDLSHHNGAVDLAAAKASGILGVIHKATQGFQFKDPAYLTNRKLAQMAAMFWGAYHFGVGADGVAQAEFFLETVQPDAQTLLVLDFEANPQGPSMNLEEARAFVTHVHENTGRWPGLYGGHYLKDLLGTNGDPVLTRCWFWLSQYGPTPVVPAAWPRWTIWQYTDGAMGPQPYEVAGIGRCDRDMFNGTSAELATFWNDSSQAASAVGST